MYSGILGGFTELLYPPVCPFCGEISKEGICRECKEKVVYIREPRCMYCGKPLENNEEEYCTGCQDRNSVVSGGRSLWLHREPVPHALYQFKYHNKRSYGEIFARELEVHYGEWIQARGIEVIIPVPLHPSKKRRRGFNQAEILARELSKRTGIPACMNALYRIKKTSPLKTMGPAERRASLKGAFGVSAAWKPARNVLLVDDIYTTGSTVERCASVLKKAGAENVWFLTISIGQGV